MASKRNKMKPKDERSSEDDVESVALGRSHRSSAQGSHRKRHTDARYHGYAEQSNKKIHGGKSDPIEAVAKSEEERKHSRKRRRRKCSEAITAQPVPGGDHKVARTSTKQSKKEKRDNTIDTLEEVKRQMQDIVAAQEKNWKVVMQMMNSKADRQRLQEWMTYGENDRASAATTSRPQRGPTETRWLSRARASRASTEASPEESEQEESSHFYEESYSYESYTSFADSSDGEIDQAIMDQHKQKESAIEIAREVARNLRKWTNVKSSKG